MLAILLCMAVAEVSQAAPCVSGCEGKHAPVCGTDGFTYLSACVAECQGVTVATVGPCPKGSGGSLKTHAKQISQLDLDRFKGDGFRLIGSAKAGDFDPVQGAARMATDAGKKIGVFATAATELELTTLRYTPDGLVYARRVPTSQIATAVELQPQPPVMPLEAENAPLSDDEDERVVAAERKLLAVFGADDRVRISSTAFPRSAGGRVQMNFGSCSGSMISTRTALTAGHCVFDRASQQWARSVTFSPNQLSSTSKPYGTYAYSFLQTFNGWTNPSNGNYWPYDFGMIRLADATVGQRTGWFGLELPTTAYTQMMYTEGYPGDKPSATYWTTSCSVTDNTRADGQIYHKCDIFAGQSGSPFYTATNYIRGVVSWEIVGNTNGCAEITSSVWTTITGWR